METSINAILTANLSDPTLTEMPVVAQGQYTVTIGKPRLCHEKNKENLPTQVLRFNFRIQSPATKHNSAEVWPSETPIAQQINLVPTDRMTSDMIVRNLAGFLQACGEEALLTADEAAQFTSMDTGEMPLPRFDGKTFAAKVTVKPDQDGNPRNNLQPSTRR